MHKVCGLVAAISLLAAPLAWAGPLPAGNASGVRQAQLSTGSWIALGGLAALSVTLIALAVSGGGTSQSQAAGANGTTTTTTTTSSTATTS